MKITISSKNNRQVFNDTGVINIGTAHNCQFKLDLDFDLILSLQKMDNGQWQIINNFKSDRVLLKGNPMGASRTIGSICKLMIGGTDEFVSINFTDGGTNPKVFAGSLELANRKSAEKMRREEAKKTISMIEDEELNEQDIATLYGTGVGAQTKIKIDRRKADIERRRALITKEIAYKSNDLRNKLAQNEVILGFLNFFIGFVPFAIVYILKDIIRLEGIGVQLQNRILFLIAIGFIIITLVLKQGQYLTLRAKGKTRISQSTVLIQRMSLLASFSIFTAVLVFSFVELAMGTYSLPVLIPQMLMLCSILCILLGVFAGFIKNIISESGEELDSYESREDFQAVVKDYQQWINLYVNNITRKKIKDMKEKIFNLQLKSYGEFFLGVITAPFLAYAVSQTLGEIFPEAAGFIRLANGALKVSPVFLALASFMIVFAFHCFSTSFAITKRINASNVIKQDGFSDYNIHGVSLHGVESSKNLKKEAKKWLFIAICVVIIEYTMNVTYFTGVMGGDILNMIICALGAALPTAILIMETTMLGNTKFEIIIREELLEKVDKDF